MKRAIDIEQLLTWAFVEELPKRNLSSAEANWDNISRTGGLGGVAIGDGHTPQRYAAISAPHPDAVIIGDRVDAIAAHLGGQNGRVAVDYELNRSTIFHEMQRLAPLAMSLPPFNIAVLVKGNAVMRRRPRWNVGQVRPQRTLAANGRAVVNGIHRNGRYLEGACCPLTWVPSVREVAEARAEYLIWHHALTEIAEGLADSLVAHAPMRPAAPSAPWIEAYEQRGQVWRNPIVTPQVLEAVKAARRKGRRAAV